jgi:hypothetical protein
MTEGSLRTVCQPAQAIQETGRAQPPWRRRDGGAYALSANRVVGTKTRATDDGRTMLEEQRGRSPAPKVQVAVER